MARFATRSARLYFRGSLLFQRVHTSQLSCPTVSVGRHTVAFSILILLHASWLVLRAWYEEPRDETREFATRLSSWHTGTIVFAGTMWRGTIVARFIPGKISLTNPASVNVSSSCIPPGLRDWRIVRCSLLPLLVKFYRLFIDATELICICSRSRETPIAPASRRSDQREMIDRETRYNKNTITLILITVPLKDLSRSRLFSVIPSPTPLTVHLCLCKPETSPFDVETEQVLRWAFRKRVL